MTTIATDYDALGDLVHVENADLIARRGYTLEFGPDVPDHIERDLAIRDMVRDVINARIWLERTRRDDPDLDPVAGHQVGHAIREAAHCAGVLEGYVHAKWPPRGQENTLRPEHPGAGVTTWPKPNKPMSADRIIRHLHVRLSATEYGEE